MSTGMQTVTINGKPKEIPVPVTLVGLLEFLSISGPHVAVECNRELVLKRDYAQRSIEAGDVLEIVTFVGGG